MRQAQGSVAGDGGASVGDFGDAGMCLPGGLRFKLRAFPALKQWAFLFRARRLGLFDPQEQGGFDDKFEGVDFSMAPRTVGSGANPQARATQGSRPQMP
jgi:hypothetical protein